MAGNQTVKSRRGSEPEGRDPEGRDPDGSEPEGQIACWQGAGRQGPGRQLSRRAASRRSEPEGSEPDGRARHPTPEHLIRGVLRIDQRFIDWMRVRCRLTALPGGLVNLIRTGARLDRELEPFLLEDVCDVLLRL